jgi:FKBP-type peptidyl-prolyl cis-trans isomerase
MLKIRHMLVTDCELHCVPQQWHNTLLLYASSTAAVAVLLLQQQLSTVYNVSAQVKIFYEGSFPDGKVFDKNYNRKSPLTFRVGLGDVIKGMDRGMKLAHKLVLKLAFYSVHDMRITQ